MSETYPSPPITEAVIEVRFAGAVEDGIRQKASDKVAAFYPQFSEQRLTQISVDTQQANVHLDQLPATFRRTSPDETEILLVNPNSLVVSQLAVYPGWEPFLARFKRDWEIWKDIAGYQKIERIGMRFINRIDVPLVDNVARHEDYLTLQIQLPADYPVTIGYSLYARIPLQDIRCFANVNSGTSDSPVPDLAAFVLDIDIVRAIDVPNKDADILALLNDMRAAKNKMFESFITDAARERFRHDQPLR